MVHEKQINIILEAVALRTDTTKEKILSPGRKRPLPYARKLTVYFIRIFFPKIKYVSIAAIFGWKRQHDLVALYYKEMREHSEKDGSEIKYDIDAIESILKTLLPAC